jgi:hypothetical protein
VSISRVVATFVILTLAACGKVLGSATLAGAINKQYGLPVAVRIEGNVVVITLQLAPRQAAAIEDRKVFAQKVAAFAKAHYSPRAPLEGIGVGFVTMGDTGLFPQGRIDAPFVFSPRNLP